MTNINITQVLTGRLKCSSCNDALSWSRIGRPEVRQNSSIYRLRCTRCGEQVVAKVIGGTYSGDAALQRARREYESLCELQSKFPQDEEFGTVIPLAHLEHFGQGIVITRLAPGEHLGRYLRSLGPAALRTACRCSGQWLKKLHESDVQNQQKSLGSSDKISFLADTYGAVLHRDPETAAACALLVREASRIDAVAVLAVRQHGDFKPDNMLCDGTRYVGLDIPWQYTGAAVYDVAPFLNHLWLESRVSTASRRRRLYALAEAGFLSGYGEIHQMHSLRWVQLYFALSYMGACRQRNRFVKLYASWKGWPLVRQLVAQLEAHA